MPISEVIIQLLDFGPNFRWAVLRPVTVKAVAVSGDTDTTGIQADDYVHVPSGVGLGIEVDWQDIEAHQAL